MAGWAHFQHMADMGVHGWGASLEEAFVQAALALTGVVTDPTLVQPTSLVEVRCEAPDPEMLLVDWLNAWVYEMSTRKMLFSRFVVAIEHGRVQGQGWGEALDRVRHHPAVEVKGATYTGLRVGVEGDGLWHARCVVDV